MITTEPADFITLGELKAYLRKTGDADDEVLTTYVSTACRMIRDRMGEVSPVTAVVEVRARGRHLVLEHRPVISITSVEELPGLEAIPEADPVTGTEGWVLESREGVLRHTLCWPGWVRITYTAGRDPVPPTFVTAALELAAHLWRTSQHNTGGGRPPVGVDEMVVPGVSYALPYSVRQLLGLDKRPQEEIPVG
ncbi:MAG: phage gp6-like head-tail connector protein [Microbispora sp.]|nr:phage gp6-like head-tail connector protein [Microbispora sp.]